MTTTQSTTVPTAAPSAPAVGHRIQNAVIKYGFIFVTVTLFAYFAISEPSFRDSATLLDTLRYVSVAAVLGLGVTLTMAVGGMDMSVGAPSPASASRSPRRRWSPTTRSARWRSSRSSLARWPDC